MICKSCGQFSDSLSVLGICDSCSRSFDKDLNSLKNKLKEIRTMQPEKIYIKNFGPFPEQTIDLSCFRDKTILLTGKNEDDEGSNTNMAGKSRFVKAFIWCMFGSRSIEDPVSEIVRHGEKECVVTVYFSDDTFITRKIKNGQMIFDYTKNGVIQSESNKDAQEIFLDDIGANKPTKILNNIIKSGIYLNTNTDTFISSTPSERTLILTNLFNLERYDEAAEKVRELSRSHNDRIKVLVEKIDEVAELRNNYEEEAKDIVLLKERKTKLEKEIKDARDFNAKIQKPDDLLKRKNEILSLAESFKKTNKQIEESRKIIDSINIDDTKRYLEDYKLKIEAMEELLKSDSEGLSSIKSQLLVKENKLEELKKQLNNPQKCPECQVDLFFSKGTLEKFDKTTALLELATVENEIQKINEKKEEELKSQKKDENSLRELKEKIEKQKEIISLFNLHKDKAKEEIKDLTALRTEYKEIETKLSNIVKEIPFNHLEDELEVINKKIILIENSFEQLKEREEKADKYKKELNEINEQISLCNLWAGAARTTKAGLFYEIKQLIFSKILINLELATNNYLLNNFKINTKIKIEADKGIQIYQLKGEEKHSLTNLTGGESSRVSICLAMAISKVFQTKLRFLILDEFFSLMDTEGIKNTFEFLDTLEGLKFVISNVPLEYDGLTIEKKEGCSYVR